MSEIRLAALLRSARALLILSFAEGFGLPIAEALPQGTPVICSDLPALRAVGQGVPEYLDPLCASAWRDAVQAYTTLATPRRDVELARMPDWRCTTGKEHVASAVAFAEGLPARKWVGASMRAARAAAQPDEGWVLAR